MSYDSLSPSRLISRLSHQPRHVLNGMISVSEPVKFSAIKRISPSSIGFLDNLPLELLHFVLELLDFQSLSRVLRVSLRGKAAVESLHAYRALIEFAPCALRGLGMIGLISYHSSATLYATLQSSQCSSCREFGAFLFLPTCVRCCYECLRRNQSLWVIPVALAKKCFKLKQSHLKGAPIMRSVPGVYSVGHRISRLRCLRLISVRDTKELAMTVHGSMEFMTELLAARPSAGTTEKALKDYYMHKFLIDAPFDPLQLNPSRVPSQGNTPADDYCGMASIPFPSLFPDKTSENGLWCRGCEWVFERYRLGKLTSHLISSLVPQAVDPFRFLLAMQHCWSKAEFLVHVKHCYGARKLVPELEININDSHIYSRKYMTWTT